MYQIWIENENGDGWTLRTELEDHAAATQAALMIFRKRDCRYTVEVRQVVAPRVVNRYEAP